MILAVSLLFFAFFSPVELIKFYHRAPTAPQEYREPQLNNLQQQQHQLDAERLYSPLYLAPPRYYPLSADMLQRLPLDTSSQLAQQQQLQQQQLREPSSLKDGSEHLNQPLAGVKGLEPQQPLALGHDEKLNQFQPASIAYLVVRPIQPAPFQQHHLFESSYNSGKTNSYQPFLQQQQHLVQQQQQLELKPTNSKQDELAGSLKGNRQTDEQAEQAIENIEQQHEIADQQNQQHGLRPSALVVPVPPGKEGKFRALMEKLVSKLTLGSSYHVDHEEIEQRPQRQPLPQQQQPVVQEQQKLEHVEEQRLEQQLEQQHRDNAYDEGVKQIKSHQQEQQQLQHQLQQQQQQIREETHLQQQQLVTKTAQEPLRQELEPLRQEAKGKLAQQQPQQLQLNQEPLRQENKSSSGSF